MKLKFSIAFLAFMPLAALASASPDAQPIATETPAPIVYDAVNTMPPSRKKEIFEDIIFTDQWIRQPSSTSVNTAAYFKITNNLDFDIVLTEVSSQDEISERTEIHGYKNDEEVKKMYKLESVTIPTKTTIEFAPGGLHVMLMGLKTPINTSMTPVLRFKISPVGEKNDVVIPEIPVMFPVK
jgi:copper(I)-binding protein